MTSPVDPPIHPSILRAYKAGHIQIRPDTYMKTWETIPHTGWRGWLIRRGFSKRLFKPERRVRIMIRFDNTYYCSYENYAHILKESEWLPTSNSKT